MKRYLPFAVFVASVFLILIVLFQNLFPAKTEIPPATLGSTAVSGTLPAPTTGISFGKRVKTSNCIAVLALPDKECTPGDIIAGVTKEEVCTPGYSKSVRNVPESEKNEVYKEYGIISRQTGEYEVDHLISLELGGSNDISNLWPELADPRPGFHEKDAVENYLHAQVCSGFLSLQEAQFAIAGNWLNVYNRTR